MIEDTLIFSTEQTALISWDAVIQNTQWPQSHGNYLVLLHWRDDVIPHYIQVARDINTIKAFSFDDAFSIIY